MSITKVLIILVILTACLHGCKSSKKTKSTQKESQKEPVHLETNNFYTTKVFGKEGPVIYVVSWIHDGGAGMRMSKDQLRILLKNKGSRKVVMAIEGSPAGKRIDYVNKWSRSTREILQFAEQQGVHIYGGENMQLNKAARAGLSIILREGKDMKVEEVCTFFWGILMVGRKRTKVLLHTLQKFKNANPDNLVIGMMGDDHFTLSEHDLLQNFAKKFRVRIVLHYTKRASRKKYPAAWPLAKCGDMKRFKKKFKKNIKRMAKEK